MYRTFLAHRRAILLCVLAASVVAVVAVLMIPNTYTASALILPPQTWRPEMGLLSQFASLQGMAMGGSMETYLQLYPVIARSREICEPTFQREFSGRRVYEVFGRLEPGEKLDPRALAALYRGFVGSIGASADLRLGYITISFPSRDPEFASFVVNEILREMDRFFNAQQRGEARKRLEMLEARLAVVNDSLRVAEEDLEFFLARNRSATSPSLQTQEMRLRRRTEMRTGVLIELTRQLEVAQIQESAKAPVMNILDRATTPALKSGPPRAAICVGIVLLSALLAFGFFVAKENRHALLRSFAESGKYEDAGTRS